MVDPSDDIDEVALSLLLAEGVDLPTAWEASRRVSGTKVRASPGRGVAIVILLVLAILALIAFAF